MIRKDTSKGISTGIKATHGKGLGTNRTTRISANPTRTRINIILTSHFRFWRLICKTLLHQELVQPKGFYKIVAGIRQFSPTIW
jgi:hypothetical protein